MNIDQLKSCFRYDPETGNIFWVAKGKGKIKKKPAGSKLYTGYIGICMGPKRILAHRIAWALHSGSWPDKQIDHINGIKTDNRIKNLRLATNSQNGKNHGKNKNNTSGYQGVSWDKINNKWRALIKVDKKSICLGRHVLFEDAVKARQEAEEKYFGEWARK